MTTPWIINMIIEYFSDPPQF